MTAPRPRRRLLLVDDDPHFVIALSRLIGSSDTVDVRSDPLGVPAGIDATNYDLALMNIDLETDDDPVLSIEALCDTLPVLAVGDDTDTETVRRALRAGAVSFASKRLDDDALSSALEDAMRRRLPAPDRRPTSEREVRTAGRLVYRSEAMAAALDRVDRFSASSAPILITGETGTGKDLVARLIHDLSHRTGRFESVNVTAIPESLFERELFGHRRGSFTGADRDHHGLFEQCSGGTLFLDEIGSLSPERQAALLRVIESGRVRPLGGESDIVVDVRIVTATNEDLSVRRREGTFRSDLWYRIARLQIHLPPLRDRTVDVVDIAQTILADRGRSYRLGEDARRLLSEHRWPGNVRELEGVIEAACLLDDDGVIGPDDLTQAGLGRPVDPDARPLLRRMTTDELLPFDDAENRVLRDLRAQAIEASLVLSEGQKSRAASLLGIGRQTLYAWMKDLGYRAADDERA